jgi:RNA polymerase sigma factor for flagellar operon FliA
MPTKETTRSTTATLTARTSVKARAISEARKEEIIHEFLPFVKYTAYRLQWRIPPQLTVDDLISVGVMGLLTALERYQEGGASLKTFAEKRIRGAMLDEIRSVEWIPRSAKKRVDEMKAAHTRLQQRMGRQVEPEEVADELGISLEDYHRTLRDASGAIEVRFEDFAPEGGTGDGFDVLECMADPGCLTPLDEMERTDVKERLAALIDSLPEKEKLVLSLYYWEELTMKEIGRVLDLTESRVCQLHSQSLLRLKGMMSEE